MMARNDRDDLRELAEQRRVEKYLRDQKILKLHRDGMSACLIGKRLRMCGSTVSAVIKAHGLEPLKPSETDSSGVPV
jgi:hypothetical protein